VRALLLLIAIGCTKGPVEVSVIDASPADATTNDASTNDAGTNDAGTNDMGTIDSGTIDADIIDADIIDAEPIDADILDGDLADADPQDSAPVDTGDEDTGAEDTGTPDTGTPDTGNGDAGMLGNFGANGFVLGPSPGFAGGNRDVLGGVTVASNNGVIAAGSSVDGAGNRRLLIVRYDAAGNLDTSFDGDGFVLGAGTDDHLRHVAIDAQSRIVVAGERGDGAGQTRSLLARYSSTGQLDTTFGNNGFVVGRGIAQFEVPFSGFTAAPHEHFAKIGLDSMGRIVAGGVASETNQDWFYRTLVARFTASGVLDTAFSGDGFAIGDGSNNNWYTGPQDELFSMALAGDAPRAVGWASNPDYSEERTMLIAFNTAGVLDPNFNAAGTPGYFMGGLTSWAGGGKQVSTDVVVDAQDRIVTTGFSFDANNVPFVYVERYFSGGTRDANFGAGGYALARPSATGSAAEYPTGIAIDGQGRIVVVGGTDDGGNGGRDRAFVYRYTSNGVLDASFNPTGVPIAGAIESWTNGSSEFAGGTDDTFNDVAATINDRIYSVGTSNGRALIVRYRDDGCLDTAGCSN
jgi:uncharacterized delta-60 repeat protein